MGEKPRGEHPVKAAGAVKLWKTQKRVSHNFTAPWKTRDRKERGAEFHTAFTGSSTGFSVPSGQGRNLAHDASAASIP